jgi:hypothetical protein
MWTRLFASGDALVKMIAGIKRHFTFVLQSRAQSIPGYLFQATERAGA